MKHKTISKALSLLLALCMVIGLFPAMTLGAAAEGTETPPSAVVPVDPASEDPAPEDPASEDPVPEDPAPEAPAPEDPAPEDPAPEEPTPEEPTPEEPAPEEPAPEDPTPEVGQKKIDAVQALINGLLAIEDADAMQAQLDAIDAAMADLTEDELAQLDLTDYEDMKAFMEEYGTGEPVATYAAGGSVYVDNVDVTDNDTVKPAGVAYDSSTNTLTLSNANLSTASLHDTLYAVIYADSGLNIVLEGENSISYSGEVPEGAVTISGIYCTGDVTISGSGSLRLQNGMESKSGAKFIDVFVDQVSDSEGSDLTIKDGATVTISGGSDASTLGGADVCGVSVSKDLTVEAGASLSVTTRDTTVDNLVPKNNNAIRTTGSITLGGTINATAGEIYVYSYPKESIAIKAATITITGETASLYATGAQDAFSVPQMTGIPATMQLLGGLTYGDPEPSTPYTITDGKASLSAAGQKAAFLRLTPIAGHGTGNTHTPEHTGQTCDRRCWYPVTQAVINENNGELPNYHYHNLYQYYLTEDIVVTKSLTANFARTV